MQLKNKRILLTGASGGIGQPIAKLLVQKGAILALVGRDLAKLNTLKAEIESLGGKAFCITADLNIAGSTERVVNEANALLGNIDILINNAGVLDFIELQDQSEARIAEMLHTNVTAPIQLTRAVVGDFQAKNKGHFVFIGSIFGSLGFPHFATYCASKFAMHGFSQSLRRELTDTKIGVTYIAPRGINTTMNNKNTVDMWNKTGNKMDDPETVAKIVVKALEAEKQEVFIGQPQSFFAWLNGTLPRAVNMGLKKQTALAAPFLTKNL